MQIFMVRDLDVMARRWVTLY